ncbi:hypothetical protein [Burkholderia sp. BDU5]|uniref:hypothetical protein n=1 Tax=Burkholderia sp. BDU5 TaxID=1385590 RepID=UPI0007521D47|nr:hypothetical protein [Burkholderia sp. BDU5]
MTIDISERNVLTETLMKITIRAAIYALPWRGLLCRLIDGALRIAFQKWSRSELCCPFLQMGIQIADLFPTVDHGDTHFDAYVDRLRRQRGISSEAVNVLEDLNELLSASRALAKAHFGSDASPDHAVALFHVLAMEIRHRTGTPRKGTE